MRKLFLFAIIAGLLWQFRAGLPWTSKSSAGVYNPDGSARVLFFTSDQCGAPCDGMKHDLDRMHITYERKALDFQDQDALLKQMDELHKYTDGQNVLPVLVMGHYVVKSYDPFGFPYEIANALGLDYLSTEKATIIRQNHFNADGSNKVVLYGTSWCPYCKQARSDLNQWGVAFEDIDVEHSRDGMHNYKALGGNGYPLIFVGTRTMSGYDASRLRQLVGR